MVSVTFSAQPDSNYASKESVGYDYATVLAKVTKTSGVHVTASGIVVYGSDDTKIKDFQQAVSNVPDAQTTYLNNIQIKQTELQNTTYAFEFVVSETFEQGVLYIDAPNSK